MQPPVSGLISLPRIKHTPQPLAQISIMCLNKDTTQMDVPTLASLVGWNVQVSHQSVPASHWPGSAAQQHGLSLARNHSGSNLGMGLLFCAQSSAPSCWQQHQEAEKWTNPESPLLWKHDFSQSFSFLFGLFLFHRSVGNKQFCFVNVPCNSCFPHTHREKANFVLVKIQKGKLNVLFVSEL